MIQRLPFYMTYDLFQDYDVRDYEYMKCAYPDVAKKLMPYVEEECDRLEYMGSMMYDEYPDQLQLRLMCRRIYDKVTNQGFAEDAIAGKWLLDLICVITWQEVMKRRKEYRKYRRF